MDGAVFGDEAAAAAAPDAADDDAQQHGGGDDNDSEEDDVAPASPSALLVAAEREAFASAPPGRQPCTECMRLTFGKGLDPAEAGFIGISGLEQHYKLVYAKIVRNKKKCSKYPKCRNWFPSVAARKAHQHRFNHWTQELEIDDSLDGGTFGCIILRRFKEMMKVPTDEYSSEFPEAHPRMQELWQSFLKASVLDYRVTILEPAMSFLMRELKKWMTEDPERAAMWINAADINGVFANEVHKSGSTAFDEYSSEFAEALPRIQLWHSFLKASLLHPSLTSKHGEVV